MIKKIGLLFVVVALVLIGGRAILRALASDEDRIRRKLDEACEGFGDARMDPILAFLSRDFADETSGFGRDDVRGAVAAAFFQEKDPTTRGFPFRASYAPESLAIALDQGGARTGQISFVVTVTDTRGQGRTAWEFKVDGTVREGEDGWQLARCSHDTRSGSARLK